MVDPNVLDAAGHMAIDWYVASLVGNKVAGSLSANGGEVGTLHILDVANGKDLEALIDRVQYPSAGGALA